MNRSIVCLPILLPLCTRTFGESACGIWRGCWGIRRIRSHLNRPQDPQKLAACRLESASSKTVPEHRGAPVSDAACRQAESGSGRVLQPGETTSPVGQLYTSSSQREKAPSGWFGVCFMTSMAFVRLEPSMLERTVLGNKEFSASCKSFKCPTNSSCRWEIPVYNDLNAEPKSSLVRHKVFLAHLQIYWICKDCNFLECKSRKDYTLFCLERYQDLFTILEKRVTNSRCLSY